jgi:hypothetical protein
VSGPDLPTALRNLANEIYALRDDRSADGAFEMVKKLDHAALGLEVLAHIVGGKSIMRAFGAPGDWGYGSPMGNSLLAFLREPPTDAHAVLKRIDRYLSNNESYEHGVMEGNGDENSVTPAKLVRATIAKAEGRP